MDFQTFNGQSQPSFGGAFPQSANSPQHPLHPQGGGQPLAQSNASFPYGQFPNGQAFPSTGGMVASSSHAPGSNSSAPMMQQFTGAMQRGAPLPQSYSTAPFSQALASPAHQQHFAHQNRQTASPASNPGQPHATPQPHQPATTLPSNAQHHPQQQQQQQQQPPQAMNQVKSEPAQAQTPVKTMPQSPVSPVAQARNQDRVATLLEINSILIKEVCDLQSQGKAGGTGQATDGKPEGDKQQPSKEYVDYMRRLQANLAYLAQNAENKHKPGQPIQPGPAIMSIPTAPPELVKLYQKLAELFPGWKGQTAQVKQSPGPQRMSSNTSVTSQQQQQQPQPPNSAGLQQNWSQTAMQNMQQAQAQAQMQHKLEQ